jgi:hypothetical protein
MRVRCFNFVIAASYYIKCKTKVSCVFFLRVAFICVDVSPAERTPIYFPNTSISHRLKTNQRHARDVNVVEKAPGIIFERSTRAHRKKLLIDSLK